MVKVFSSNLNHSFAGQEVPPSTLRYIRSKEIELARLDWPSGINLDAGTTAVIRASIFRAFVFGFRTVMSICARLSLAGAVVAWQMIPDRTK